MNTLEQALVRPVAEADLPALLSLAAKAGVGLTTLPNNAALLAARIEASQRALARDVSEPHDESYLFVLEVQGRVVACSGLVAAVGTEQAFYNYHVGRSVFASRELNVYRSIPTLYLSNDLTGSSELSTLFVDPDWRGGGVGKLISFSRFLFIAAHRQRFADRVIAELRGVADAAGRSPFWESLGRQFFAMEFSQADRLSVADSRAYIAELMPRHPVYTVLLSAEAQQVIGQVHEHTTGARRLLEQEGFRYRDYVDIFDAGPAIEADTGTIKSIRKARRLCAGALTREANVMALVSNLADRQFRALQAPVAIDGDRVGLGDAQLRTLEAEVGDTLLVRPLKRLASAASGDDGRH